MSKSTDMPGGETEEVFSWDEETVELMAEFLNESDEGLSQCDEVLLGIEHDGADKDGVDTLFRAFHTIKGTAGFLDLEDITIFAHRTENLLAKVRDGLVTLEGLTLDLVFESVEVMRHHLDAAREACDARSAVRRLPEFKSMVAQLDEALNEASASPAATPQDPGGVFLGPLLTGGAPVPPKAQDAVLAPQDPSASSNAEQPAAANKAEPSGAAPGQRPQKDERNAPAKAKESIRVDLERVDSLVELIGELVIAEAMVANAPDVVNLASPSVRLLMGRLGKISRDLQSIGMRMRMVPLRGTFQKMARLVRDVSRKADKRVWVEITGESTELDRSMVEGIRDPLVHIIRNAIDHGVESAEERLAAGKPETGLLTLRSYHEAGSVVIEVSDDGKGLDRERILSKAIDKGLIRDGSKMTDAEVFQLIFAPGFSTAQAVTQISGRGVGMDVVRRNVESMRGRVTISSKPGEGSVFKLILPLTLAIIDGMLVRVGTERYIVPTQSIVESVQPSTDMVGRAAGDLEYVDLRGEVLPLFRLSTLLNIEGAEPDLTRALVLVVEGLGQKVALVIDEVLTQQQVVIKSLGSGIGRARFVSGAAVLSDGLVGVILDVEGLAQFATEQQEKRRGAEEWGAPA